MNRRNLTAAVSAFSILAIILDPGTAISGASEAVELCIKTVIPSLFPLMVLSMLLCSSLTGAQTKPLIWLGKLCKIPAGSECLLIPAFLGGYPVGAQAVSQAYCDGMLSKSSALRLLAFCSNAGPSFIFGMIAAQFDDPGAVWALWIIHMASALAVGMLLPLADSEKITLHPTESVTLPAAVKRSIQVMAEICGWIVLFRVLIRFLESWVLRLVSIETATVIIGILELSNGCIQLRQIADPGIRFIAASCLLSFGGLCVLMQTSAVTKKLGINSYFKGKLLQSACSMVLSCFYQICAGQYATALPLSLLGSAILATFAVTLRQKAKNSSNPLGIGV